MSKNCDQPRQPRNMAAHQGTTSAPTSSPPSNAPVAKLNTVTHKTAAPETYMKVEICNQLHKCLLDTGCDHSIIPRKLVPTATLEPASVDLTAANGSPINVLGHMTIKFKVKRQGTHRRPFGG